MRQRGHERLASVFEIFLELTRQLIGERILRTSAALAFTSILALVPLMAVSFAILRSFVTHGKLAEEIREWMLNTLLADSVAGINTYIEKFLDTSQNSAIGLVGLTVLLFTSLALFLSVESAVNAIWRVRLSRPLYRRLVTFYAVITLTPALMGLGMASANWILKYFEAASVALSLSGFVSTGMILTGLTLMYKLMPHTTVRWRYALLGGFWATIVFQLTRLAFNLYVESVYTGSVTARIYGTFALVPIFFFWVHASWIIILSGVSVSYMLQHKGRVVWNVHRRRAGQIAESPVSPQLVAQVFAVTADVFYREGGGTTVHRISHVLNREQAEIEDALSLLKQASFILQVTDSDYQEIIPARPLHQVKVVDILTLARPNSHPASLEKLAILDALKKVMSQAQLQHDMCMETTHFLELLQSAWGPENAGLDAK